MIREGFAEGSVLGEVIDTSDQGDPDVGTLVGQVSSDSNYDDTELQEWKRLLAKYFSHIDLLSGQRT